MDRNMMDNNREILLKRVQNSNFALIEANLFLDTHPTDKAALEYFKKHQEILKQATKEFTEKYGPLKASDYEGEPSWEWISDPWPWEISKEA